MAEPKPNTFTNASRAKLKGVHPDLVRVMERALPLMPAGMTFTITEGVRTLSRQRALLKAGASRTLKSRHLTGHAVDIAVFVNGRLSWEFPVYLTAAGFIKQAARELGVRIEWGGDWPSFRDGPHFQLPWTVIDNPAFPLVRATPPAPVQPVEEELALVPGSVGPRVRQLQEVLGSIGYVVAVDGDYGPRTADAVRMAQGEVTRPKTGIATAADVAAFRKLAAAKAREAKKAA
jgi:peptidoglycan L-alanyl-D-glutamate endopeptidase CwlK